MKTLIFIFVILAVLCILYINGYLIFKNIKSVYFVGKHGFMDKRCTAKFSACTGNIRKIMKFKEKRLYNFFFDAKLENGEAKAVIRNSQGKDILVLTAENPSGTLNVSDGRYTLIFEMYKAYGSYELTWK